MPDNRLAAIVRPFKNLVPTFPSLDPYVYLAGDRGVRGVSEEAKYPSKSLVLSMPPLDSFL
jgi:hypothetical protein